MFDNDSAWRRSRFPMAQVQGITGASAGYYWRKCGFGVETCAAKRASARSNGADPHPISTPAPTTMRTCADNYQHLRHRHDTPGFLKFKRTWICLSLSNSTYHVLLVTFKNRGKHTDVPWRPYKEVKCARDFDMGRLHRAAGGDGGIRVSANTSREGRRVPGRDAASPNCRTSVLSVEWQ